MPERRDTICALASGAPPSALAVIRVSGGAVRDICERLLASGLPAPRQAVLTRLSDFRGTGIDDGIAVFFPGPRSYTGEDVLELTLHGGPAVIRQALESLTSLPFCRLAEPGEFTRRAFEAGKLDLTQAEGIADLIGAETDAQKAQALRQVSGGLTQIYQSWREELIALLALIEVEVDFPDEGDVPERASHPVARRLSHLIAEIETALGDGGIGERIRDGFRIALIGAPNSGKSTLLNRLAGRDAAIVTPLPGTTRDVIEIRCELGGQIVWISDTAGLRETSDLIEAEGIRRARAAAAAADLRVFLIEAAAPDLTAVESGLRLPYDIIVLSKSDLAKPDLNFNPHHILSALTGEGCAAFESTLATFLRSLSTSIEAPVITRLRHREKLSAGLAALKIAKSGFDEGIGPEFIAEDFRLALRHLGGVLGTVDAEDVLSAVFSKFCIGK